jgi:hypothetical protein
MVPESCGKWCDGRIVPLARHMANRPEQGSEEAKSRPLPPAEAQPPIGDKRFDRQPSDVLFGRRLFQNSRLPVLGP